MTAEPSRFRYFDVVSKALSGTPTLAAVVDGWIIRAIPIADVLRHRAAFLSTLLAVFGLSWVWLRKDPKTFKPAFRWIAAGVGLFLIYLTLWDRFPYPLSDPWADQAVRHGLVLSYALTFFAFSVGFALLFKAASTDP